MVEKQHVTPENSAKGGADLSDTEASRKKLSSLSRKRHLQASTDDLYKNKSTVNDSRQEHESVPPSESIAEPTTKTKMKLIKIANTSKFQLNHQKHQIIIQKQEGRSSEIKKLYHKNHIYHKMTNIL